MFPGNKCYREEMQLLHLNHSRKKFDVFTGSPFLQCEQLFKSNNFEILSQVPGLCHGLFEE